VQPKTLLAHRAWQNQRYSTKLDTLFRKNTLMRLFSAINSDSFGRRKLDDV